MTGDAVLFDFSATLFDPVRVVHGPAVAHHAAARGVRLDPRSADALAVAFLTHADTPAGRRARAGCDLSAAAHRRGWLATAAGVPGVTPPVAEALHDCITCPERWLPYPDTAGVLTDLHDAGVRVAVVSNCGWDIRQAFRSAGLLHLVDAWALSFEHGVAKPDRQLFRLACSALGTPPSEVLMVGDDPGTDTGAIALGAAVHLLPPARPFPAPRGLDVVRRLTGEGEPYDDVTTGDRLEPGPGGLHGDRRRHRRPAR